MSVKLLIPLMLLTYTSNASINLPSIKSIFSKVDENGFNLKNYTVHYMRVTYYSPNEGDGYGWANAHPKIKRSKEGVTVACHKDFPFNAEVIIPQLDGRVGDGKFLVQDRGGAINSKKASGGKLYVIDVFLSNNRKRDKAARKYPMYMKVYVKKVVK